MSTPPAQPWRATVLTVFPEMFPGPLAASLAGRALARDAWRLAAVDLRDYATDRHRSVDGEPFGGGPGMVMRADVIDAALADVTDQAGRVDRTRPFLYLTPRGRPFDQARARALAGGPGVVLLCGRFEGVDQRVLDAWAAEEVSIGDFVLSGGEIAAMAVIDACVRLLPGVVGARESLEEESFEGGLLEYPQFTRPQGWRDRRGRERRVPAVLVSGHHAEIATWRQAEAQSATRTRRPDLWARYESARSAGSAPGGATRRESKG